MQICKGSWPKGPTKLPFLSSQLEDLHGIVSPLFPLPILRSSLSEQSGDPVCGATLDRPPGEGRRFVGQTLGEILCDCPNTQNME